MINVENLKLKFLVKRKAGCIVVFVKNAPNTLLYAFVVNNNFSANSQRIPNKTRLFFKRFRFIVGVIDRLVKNGLLS